MRNLLIHADASRAMAARTETALAIGRRNRSHLSFLIASPFQQFIATDPFGGMYLAAGQLAKAELADQELAERLGSELAREDVPWDVAIADGDALSVMSLAATLADLAIVSLGQPNAPMTAGDLAMTVPVPVLAIPESGGPVDLDAPAMVAWNGSPQAAHALRAAVPLIRDASEVILVTVGADDGRIPAEDALLYLSRHGIHADFRQVERGADTAEEVLERQAKAIAPGLIVMGAFGRPRLRETLFGGVTRYLFEAAPAPLLLAH